MDFITEYGHAPPMCTQFSVFLENRVGRLHDLVEMFEGQPIRVVAFSILEASDHAVVRMVATKPDLARQILQGEKLAFSESEILIVELGPHQRLSDLCRVLLSAELNIHYAYSLMVRPHGATTVGLHCDDQMLAGQLLQRKKFKLVDEEELRRAAGDDPAMA
jgi:hypothetical protein